MGKEVGALVDVPGGGLPPVASAPLMLPLLLGTFRATCPDWRALPALLAAAFGPIGGDGIGVNPPSAGLVSSLKALISASKSRHCVKFASALRPCNALLQENDKVVGVLLTEAFAVESVLDPDVFAPPLAGVVMTGVAALLVFAVLVTVDRDAGC